MFSTQLYIYKLKIKIPICTLYSKNVQTPTTYFLTHMVIIERYSTVLYNKIRQFPPNIYKPLHNQIYTGTGTGSTQSLYSISESSSCQKNSITTFSTSYLSDCINSLLYIKVSIKQLYYIVLVRSPP